MCWDGPICILDWAHRYVGLGPFICWVGPIDMWGWARWYDGLGTLICMICGILENSLSFVLIVLWFNIFRYFQFQREEPGLTAQHPLMAFYELITFDLL